MSNWISVEDELPNKPKYYLVFTRCGSIWNTSLLFWNMGDVTPKWEDRDRDYQDNVTHWMPLPEPPKGE